MEARLHDTKLTRTIASTATIKLANFPGFDLVYTPLEERFERLTRLARRSLAVPVAGVALVSEGKQWFKSIAGWNVSELPGDFGLCQWAIAADGLHVIPDMSADPRTASHPFVVGQPHFRFYAGFPLVDHHGLAVGAFCVLDVKRRDPSAAEQRCILDLAALTQQEILADHLTSAQTALVSKLSVARREAMIDPLTRLWNRRGAGVLLKAALEKADRDRQTLGIVVLDLDNFKRVNDTYGHQVGDELLRKVGARLVSAVRAQDLTFRLGGDEFLMLIATADEKSAQQIAERVRRAITDEPVPTRSGALVTSASLGVTLRAPGEKVTVEDLLDRADRALMRSKADGRNRVRVTA